MRAGRWILGIPFAALAGQYLYYSPRLPERVASHFDASGNPDGWSSKGAFFATFAIGLLVVTAVFWGISLLIPRLPRSLINLPRKDYWLAPERRQDTMAFIGRRLVEFVFALQVFLVGILHLSIRANLATGAPRTATGFWILLGIFLAFSAAWTVIYLLHFLRVPR
ncbi:MAG: DUF1648 domain-containing protein [Planctomycetes bacterium]|nr:DUF1648 domain-containing protein [Planctomycetota bacterium]